MFAASKFSALGQVIKKTKRRACLCVFVPACACLCLFVVLTVSQLPLVNCVQIIGSISLDYPLDLLSPPPLPIVPPLYCTFYLHISFPLCLSAFAISISAEIVFGSAAIVPLRWAFHVPSRVLRTVLVSLSGLVWSHYSCLIACCKSVKLSYQLFPPSCCCYCCCTAAALMPIRLAAALPLNP